MPIISEDRQNYLHKRLDSVVQVVGNKPYMYSLIGLMTVGLQRQNTVLSPYLQGSAGHLKL